MAEELKIIFYGTSWCGDCLRARRVFEKLNISYVEIDIDRDVEGRKYVETVNRGMRSVPTIVFPNGDVLVEPPPSMLLEKLQGLKADGSGGNGRE